MSSSSAVSRDASGENGLFALERVLQIYVEGRQNMPRMDIIAKVTESAQAQKIRDALGMGEVMVMQSFSGGGALPNQAIDSVGYFLRTDKCQKIADMLRRGEPSILVRIQNRGICIDPRTLLEGEVDTLIDVLRDVVAREL